MGKRNLFTDWCHSIDYLHKCSPAGVKTGKCDGNMPETPLQSLNFAQIATFYSVVREKPIEMVFLGAKDSTVRKKITDRDVSRHNLC